MQEAENVTHYAIKSKSSNFDIQYEKRENKYSIFVLKPK